jgi:ATP-dependent Lon protease
MRDTASNKPPAIIDIEAPAGGASGRGDGAGAGPDEPRIPAELPLLPLRNTVMFPGMVAPLSVGRPSSVKMLSAVLPHGKIIGVVAQRDGAQEEPGAADVYSVGTAVTVLKLLREIDGGVVVVRGLQRFVIRRFVQTQPWLQAEIELLPGSVPPANDQEW